MKAYRLDWQQQFNGEKFLSYILGIDDFILIFKVRYEIKTEVINDLAPWQVLFLQWPMTDQHIPSMSVVVIGGVL